MPTEPWSGAAAPTVVIDTAADAASRGVPLACRADGALPPAVPGYRMLRPLGAGGQAIVFLAEQASTSRRVAVKVLPGGPFVDPRVRARFDREAAILATLDHPNVVRIVDRCRADDGSLALVMDYVEGRPIDVALHAESPGADHARAVALMFAAVADGVDEAHRRGIVHRDLKPSNVLVDARGTPRVLDFGVARLCGACELPDPLLTETGQMVGSLPWASPEQIAGVTPDTLDARSDVYSLGVMLYRALTGQGPYPESNSVGQLVRAIERTDPPAPHAQPGARARGVDAALSAVVLRALAKRPADRYRSAGDVARDLRQWAAGQRPVAMRSVVRRARVRRLALAMSAVTAVGLAALATTVAPLADAPAPPGRVTVMPLPARTNSVGMRMVFVPGGTFTMGSRLDEPGRGPDEMPFRQATVSGVWVSTTEVTRAQFHAVMGWLPSAMSPAAADAAPGDVPVDGVMWEQAYEFCARLSQREGQRYRLPFEAEWEWACRAGTTVPWAGNGVASDMGWHDGNGGGRLHAVGRKLPNAWGLLDAHGNAAEWCADEYDTQYRRLPALDTPAVMRVVRGGSVYDPAHRTRSAARAACGGDEPPPGIGFRVVMDPSDQAGSDAEGIEHTSTRPQ